MKPSTQARIAAAYADSLRREYERGWREAIEAAAYQGRLLIPCDDRYDAGVRAMVARIKSLQPPAAVDGAIVAAVPVLGMYTDEDRAAAKPERGATERAGGERCECGGIFHAPDRPGSPQRAHPPCDGCCVRCGKKRAGATERATCAITPDGRAPCVLPLDHSGPHYDGCGAPLPKGRRR